MAQAGGNNDIFTNRNFIGDGDIESGSITENVINTINKASPIENSLAKLGDVGDNGGHADDIDKWVASLERILEDVPSYMCSLGHPGRISRIPENLRELDVKGYEPYILSIGPYHHGKPRVQQMEMRKRLALKHVIEYNPNVTLKDYLSEILSVERTARSFYSDVNMDTEKFVRMMLFDSVSIVTLFRRLEKSKETTNEIIRRIESQVINEDGYVEESQMNENLKMIVGVNEPNVELNIGENWYWAMFAHDLFLVENQIPFFVLEKIHNLVFGCSGTEFMDIMKYEVTNMFTYYTKPDSDIILRTEEVHHLLHLCHIFFRPTVQQEAAARHVPETSQMFRLGSAIQLYEAGVHFQSRSPSAYYSLLDITFDSSGNMAMPCLHVEDNTESLLRNLIALEQMKYPTLGLNVSAYIVLLLHLITTPKDVELLRRKEIIQHHLASDKEMMYLVNRLSMGLAFDYVEDKYSLKHVFHELKRYSERRVPRWRAWLKHRHFSNPWTIISVLVASFFLLLTFLQTYYSVYSYYYPYLNRNS